MKKNYERLRLEVISFNKEEILMTSCTGTSCPTTTSSSSSTESLGEVGPGNDTVNPSNETY